jgi:hypothetical protein
MPEKIGGGSLLDERRERGMVNILIIANFDMLIFLDLRVLLPEIDENGGNPASLSRHII